mmetsp:Transcript_8468/g.11930  ORF Transcript_8468/g.11930 Transcript_8468/m.11930 type:complete len:215 (+) Transcript_8468:373-1017(+)
MPIGVHEFINLGLDVDPLSRSHQLLHFNLVVKVADVSDDRVVLHHRHQPLGNDALISRSRYEYIARFHHRLKPHHAEPFHGSLQRADRVNLSHVNDRPCRLHRLCTPLPNIPVPADQHAFTGNHHIRGSAQPIRERMLAPVQIIELRLRHAVVDVDGREEELLGVLHLVQAVDASGGLFRHAEAAFGNLGPLPGIVGKLPGDDSKHDFQLSGVR